MIPLIEERGAIAIDQRMLSEYVGSFTGDEITIETISDNLVNIYCGKSKFDNVEVISEKETLTFNSIKEIELKNESYQESQSTPTPSSSSTPNGEDDNCFIF